MADEILKNALGGPGRQVEIDKTYLTRRKYQRGRLTKSRSICLLGIYERHTGLGYHIQVRNKSADVLPEICRLVLPGSTIMTDAMPSYHNLGDLGYQHQVVVHKKEFVNSEDRSVHTQNIKIRNRWAKKFMKSARDDRTLNSYLAEYSYRTVAAAV